MITKKNLTDALTENASVVAGLIPLATADNNGLMPKGLRSYNNYNNNKYIEILTLESKSGSKSIDCFIGFSKNHEDTFVLCALHAYSKSPIQNAFIKVIVEKDFKGYNFYMLKVQDKSISIILENLNQYSDIFVAPIYSCTFSAPEFKVLDALPEGAELIQIVQ